MKKSDRESYRDGEASASGLVRRAVLFVVNNYFKWVFELFVLPLLAEQLGIGQKRHTTGCSSFLLKMYLPMKPQKPSPCRRLFSCALVLLCEGPSSRLVVLWFYKVCPYSAWKEKSSFYLRGLLGSPPAGQSQSSTSHYSRAF